jgi:hypothetical protein
MHFLPFAPCHVLLQPGRDFLGTLACAETLISKSKGDFASSAECTLRTRPRGKARASERVTQRARLASKE